MSFGNGKIAECMDGDFCWHDQILNGRAIMTWIDEQSGENTYKGSFIEGKMHRKGTLENDLDIFDLIDGEFDEKGEEKDKKTKE